MRIAYMGTPDFAVPALEALYEAGHDILCVVTQPDSVRDRGKRIKFSPVKETALKLGLDVLQPERVKGNEEFINVLESMEPDLIVVAAYGQLLPKNVLDIPKFGCVNIHGSLLPKFRGAAPIQRAVLEGEEVTGVTIMFMEEGLDTGNMLAKASTPVDGKTGGQLHDELAILGAKLLVDTIPNIAEMTGEKQNDEESNYAHMISKKEGHVDFSKTPVQIERMIRAFDPWPGTFAYAGEKLIKFWKAEAIDRKTGEAAGTVVNVSGDGLDIAAGGKILRITEIQVPGKKRVAVKEYLKGNSIEIGTVLG